MTATLARKLNAALGRSLSEGWNPAMDLHKIISELQSEKQRLDEAILALERLSTNAAAVPKARRGRPPLQKQPVEAKTAAQGQTIQS